MGESNTMQTASSMAMFSPEGEVHLIPNNQVKDALQAGGQPAVPMTSPDGNTHWIPASKVSDAQKAGGKVDWSKVPQEHHEGFWGALGNDLLGMVKSAPRVAAGMVPGVQPALDTIGIIKGDGSDSISQGMALRAADQKRKQEGRSMAYRAVAPLGTVAAGLNVEGMENAANEGDTNAVLGHAAAPPVAMAATIGAAKVGSKAIPAMQDAVGNKFIEKSTSAVRSTVPEAANMHPRAVFGAEKIYRAAAPVGSDPMWRSNLYAAAGDLAEIGKTIDGKLEAATGGTFQPDMRVTATRNAINEHLSKMYSEERAPQVARHAHDPIVNKFNPDSQIGLDYLAKNAGLEADRALAAKALSGETMTLAETDALARAVNRELSPLRGMTPQELAQIEGHSKRMGSLQSLDGQLGESIANDLQNRGEAGVKQYERRYAALSDVRNQLQTRINATELQRNIPGARVVRHFMGGKSGIASASQAAIADVNIGKELQSGFRELAKSGITPNRPTGSGAPPVRGLLNAPATQLPSSMEPLGEPSAPAINIEPTTRAQRKGLLLPEKAGGPQAVGVSGNLGPELNNPPNGYSGSLTKMTAKQASAYVRLAKGNRALAEQLAAKDGFRF